MQGFVLGIIVGYVFLGLEFLQLLIYTYYTYLNILNTIYIT